MNVPDLHRRAADLFGRRVHEVPEDGWTNPTPNTEWDVRALVNHLVSESLWTPELFAGRTVAEVGDRFDGDVLGDDPVAAWDASIGPAVAAVQAPGAMDMTVHLSFGDAPGREYALQLFADYLVHSWDLARGIGADDSLDPELVDACAAWFASVEDDYRSAGAIGARPPVPDGADAQARLLAMFGRRA
jgi:uncharacterized protein (TIGR03086 family)